MKKREYSRAAAPLLALGAMNLFGVTTSAAPLKAVPKKAALQATKPVAAGFDVVRGKKAAAIIVLPDAANAVEKYAAQELRDHLQKATGATLQIVAEKDAPPTSARLYVGAVRALESIGYSINDPNFGVATRVPDEKISAAAPTTLTTNPGLPGAKLLGGGDGTALAFTIDAGAVRKVAALQLKNYAGTASNYNIARIEVAGSDDGQNFAPLATAQPQPLSNGAGEMRRIDLRQNGVPVKARYFRVRVLANFWGDVADSKNANAQSAWFAAVEIVAPPASTRASQKVVLSSLPRNTSLIESKGDALFLAGRDDISDPLNDATSAGTLFAVYAWLEKTLGARWLWPGENGVWVQKSAGVKSGGWKTKFEPAFLHTRWRLTNGNAYFQRSDAGFTPQQRARAVQQEAVWYRRQRFHRSLSLDIRHSFAGYWERFGKTHPEYFNQLPDGTRRPDPTWYSGEPQLVSMAVGNPELWKQVVAQWKKTRTDFEPYIDASENDTQGKSLDSLSLAMDVRDPSLADWDGRIERATAAYKAGDTRWARLLGSLSDRYARYYLAVQNEARVTDPNAVVMGFAYENYTDPPRATKLNKDIIVALVPEYFYPRSEAQARKFEAQWNGWRDTGASLMLRPNATLSSYLLPLSNTAQIEHDFKFAAQRGLIGTDYDSLTSMFSTQGANIYTLARLSRDPKMSRENILREYSQGFGKAAPQIRAYLDFWENLTTQRQALMAKLLKDLKLADYFDEHRVAGKVLVDADFARGQNLLDNAQRAATGDSDALGKIDFLQMGLEQARLATIVSRDVLNEKDAADATAAQHRTAKAFATLDKQRAQLGEKYPAALNLDFAAANELRGWNRATYSALVGATLVQSLPLQWQLRWDDDSAGENEKWFAGNAGDDALWQSVRTDSAWEKQPVGESKKAQTGKDYDGRAWYRATFRLDEKLRGQKLQLLFGAVDESAWIYLNGKKVGEHLFVKPNDWQTPFRIDLPADVRYGEDNDLYVLVEDKVGDGGIWKPVYVVKAPSTRVWRIGREYSHWHKHEVK